MNIKSIRIETENVNGERQGYLWNYGDEIEGLLNAKRAIDQYIVDILNPISKVLSATKPIEP